MHGVGPLARRHVVARLQRVREDRDGPRREAGAQHLRRAERRRGRAQAPAGIGVVRDVAGGVAARGVGGAGGIGGVAGVGGVATCGGVGAGVVSAVASGAVASSGPRGEGGAPDAVGLGVRRRGLVGVAQGRDDEEVLVTQPGLHDAPAQGPFDPSLVLHGLYDLAEVADAVDGLLLLGELREAPLDALGDEVHAHGPGVPGGKQEVEEHEAQDKDDELHHPAHGVGPLLLLLPLAQLYEVVERGDVVHVYLGDGELRVPVLRARLLQLLLQLDRVEREVIPLLALRLVQVLLAEHRAGPHEREVVVPAPDRPQLALAAGGLAAGGGGLLRDGLLAEAAAAARGGPAVGDGAALLEVRGRGGRGRARHGRQHDLAEAHVIGHDAAIPVEEEDLVGI
mmetsp:Transcript_43488/g.138461  ORF Transcript_43488/g.138461 Transcript_43488/m.138461 type:complete len:396 (-) Transcript_43488:520-1707(-)